MEGEPVARAVPAAAPWVYTLYRKAEGPFVHALNTDGFALCIDLPAAARSGAAAAREWGLVLSPDESTLYAANPALGLVVEIAAGDAAEVRRTARIPRGAIGAAPRLAVAPDGRTLYVPTARRRRRGRHRDAGGAADAAARPSGERGGRRAAGACTRRTARWSRLDAASGAVLGACGDLGAAGCAGGGAAGAVAVVRSALALLRGVYGRIEGKE